MDTQVIIAIIGAITTILTALIGADLHITKRTSKEMQENNTVMKRGIQQTLHHQLKEIFDEWWDKISIKETHKFVPEDIVDEFMDLYNAYHILGENGKMTKAKLWMEQHQEVPTPDKL